MKGHCLFDLPVMVSGAVLGVMADVALVQRFHLAKAWAFVGLVPGAFLGGFVAFRLLWCFINAFGWIDERVRRSRSKNNI